MQLSVVPFEYQAGCNTFSGWVTLLTLCLAPLIAHVVSGTPSISYLAHSRPSFIDRACHYNPTSIIWRYAAIFDRRLRATKWCPNDLAATNAIFWTTKGWNGDESMVFSAMPYRVQTPQKAHIDVFSSTMLKTIIVSLQGVSALYTLVNGLIGTTRESELGGLGLNAVFFPIAILGLLRLCAAAWLADDFAYIYTDNPPRGDSKHDDGFNNDAFNDDGIPLIVTAGDMDPWLITPLKSETYFRAPNSSWTSCAFRTFYLLICFGIWTLILLVVLPLTTDHNTYTVTTFLGGIFYFVFFTISSLIYAIYFLRGKTTTTIIPCISSSWYKAYTVLLIVAMLTMVTISAIQTNRAPDGSYITYALPIPMDCASRTNWLPVSPWNTFSGVMALVPDESTFAEADATGVLAAGVSNETTISNARYVLQNFTGYCAGQLGVA